MKLKQYSFTSVKIALVSNDGLASEIQKLTERYLVLLDPIPDLSQGYSQYNKRGFVIFVCSFAIDEPWEEMFRAAEQLQDVQFVCTGKAPKTLSADKIPSNVQLTGFVSNDKYKALMNASSCVIALTTEPECLQCAAYEAIACSKPMVLSNNAVLRNNFRDAAVYVENNYLSIAEGLQYALNNFCSLIHAQSKLRSIFEDNLRHQTSMLKKAYRESSK